uniref:Uncharacterized protein n=1 Tax=Panagrolaimus sp. JU765 TaxID=591449 RepID=A0AC34QZG1_9BILA
MEIVLMMNFMMGLIGCLKRNPPVNNEPSNRKPPPTKAEKRTKTPRQKSSAERVDPTPLAIQTPMPIQPQIVVEKKKEPSNVAPEPAANPVKEPEKEEPAPVPQKLSSKREQAPPEEDDNFCEDAAPPELRKLVEELKCF